MNNNDIVTCAASSVAAVARNNNEEKKQNDESDREQENSKRVKTDTMNYSNLHKEQISEMKACTIKNMTALKNDDTSSRSMLSDDDDDDELLEVCKKLENKRRKKMQEQQQENTKLLGKRMKENLSSDDDDDDELLSISRRLDERKKLSSQDAVSSSSSSSPIRVSKPKTDKNLSSSLVHNSKADDIIHKSMVMKKIETTQQNHWHDAETSKTIITSKNLKEEKHEHEFVIQKKNLDGTTISKDFSNCDTMDTELKYRNEKHSCQLAPKNVVPMTRLTGTAATESSSDAVVIKEAVQFDENKRDSSAWSCHACTFLHQIDDADRTQCKVCDTPRMVVYTNDGSKPGAISSKTTSSNLSNVEKKTIRTADPFITEFGRWVWDGQGMETLDEWLQAARPSKVSSRQCAWIQVENVKTDSLGYSPNRIESSFDPAPYRNIVLNKLMSEINSGKRISAQKKRECMNQLMEIAKSQNFTVGKWLLWFQPSTADMNWEDIARATALGKLGCSAKINPTMDMKEDETAVCCIYVSDFYNKVEVKRVLVELQRMGYLIKCGFKPDFLTDLGIYSGNKYRLPPTIYSVKQVELF